MNFEPSTYMLLLGAHVAAVIVVIAAIFLRYRWLRNVAVLAGAGAIWLPLFILINTLGEPHPRPPGEVMKLLGVVEDDRQLYLFVDKKRDEPTTRMYNVRLVKNKYDDGMFRVQQTPYDLLGVQVTPTDSGDWEVVYLDYVAPDWDKGGMQRSWRASTRAADR